MSNTSPLWKTLNTLTEFRHLINESKNRPVLVLKHDSLSSESTRVKKELDAEWIIPEQHMHLYIVNSDNKELCREISSIAGIEEITPQLVLFADGVVMYDESGDLISFKKIKLALKIVNRTFKWIESRA
jgi:bacillithiol system protein YtxJ